MIGNEGSQVLADILAHHQSITELDLCIIY